MNKERINEQKKRWNKALALPQERGKVNVEIVAEMVSQGYPRWKAALMAGSTAKSKLALTQVATKALHRTSNIALIETLKEKEEMILSAMSTEKAESSTLQALSKALGTLIEKRRLLEDKSTDNKAIIVKWQDTDTFMGESNDNNDNNDNSITPAPV